MKPLPPLRRLVGDQSGATIVEFAMILPALCVVLMGIFDMGYKSYVASVVQGALHDAARRATVGGVTPAEIDTMVRNRLDAFSDGATVDISTQSYHEFSEVGQAEPFTIDNAPFNEVNSGDCWRDFVANGDRDDDRGRDGLGNADDVVMYTVSISYDRLFPIHRLLGWSSRETVAASTLLSNQPFAGRDLTVPIACED